MGLAIIAFLVCITATTLGAITGMGGGVIIKPVMDAVAPQLGAAQINFLSGCTVLAMSLVSCLRSKGKSHNVSGRVLMLLAVGGALGGIIGNFTFDLVADFFSNNDMVKIIQNSILIILIGIVFIYLNNQSKIKTLQVKSSLGSFLVGFFLGVASAFLGIGGGPINLVVLYFFFSMTPKVAAYCSIFIIMLSQGCSFLTTLVSGVPDFEILMMVLMVIGGVAGGFIGRYLDSLIDDDKTQVIFKWMTIGILCISAYNIISSIISMN